MYIADARRNSGENQAKISEVRHGARPEFHENYLRYLRMMATRSFIATPQPLMGSEEARRHASAARHDRRFI